MVAIVRDPRNDANHSGTMTFIAMNAKAAKAAKLAKRNFFLLGALRGLGALGDELELKAAT